MVLELLQALCGLHPASWRTEQAGDVSVEVYGESKLSLTAAEAVVLC